MAGKPAARRRTSRATGGPGAAAPHVELANDYARRVVAGEEIAGKWTRRACERHLRDLERQDSADFPYLFSADSAERICRFAELLRHVKGKLAGQLFRLEPWECFFLCSFFGWLRAGSLLRRFKRFYLEVARGNGKSFLLSVIALFMLAADGESGAEVYSAATSRDQAKIVFTVAKEVARRSPEFLAHYGIDLQAHAIVQTNTASAFTALASEDRTLDGLNGHFIAIDELHAHPTRGVYDVLETAIGKREQPILGVITTAGWDRSGICYEVRGDLIKILDQVASDESFFGVVYTLDDDDSWKDESIWKKANPNLGVSVNLDTLRDLARKAERTPAAQAAFQTKHLNVWVSVMRGLFDMEGFRKGRDLELTREKLAGAECILAIDLAGKNDFSVIVEVYRTSATFGAERYAALCHTYTNRAYVERTQHASFGGWEIEDRLKVTEGNVTDHAIIAADAVEAARATNCLEVDLDMNYNAIAMAGHLQEAGLNVVDIPQSMKQLSEATRHLIDVVADGRFAHDGDPALDWMFGNVVGYFDTKGNVYPRKLHDDSKIDAVVATAMAISSFQRRGGEAFNPSESPVEVL